MINIRLANQGEIVMSKGSGKRKQDITDKELEENWNRIFSSHPNDEQFEKIDKALTSACNDWSGIEEDDYGNCLNTINYKGK